MTFVSQNKFYSNFTVNAWTLLLLDIHAFYENYVFFFWPNKCHFSSHLKLNKSNQSVKRVLQESLLSKCVQAQKKKRKTPFYFLSNFS